MRLRCCWAMGSDMIVLRSSSRSIGTYLGDRLRSATIGRFRASTPRGGAGRRGPAAAKKKKSAPHVGNHLTARSRPARSTPSSRAGGGARAGWRRGGAQRAARDDRAGEGHARWRGRERGGECDGTEGERRRGERALLVEAVHA